MSDRYSYLEGTSEMKMKTKGASSFIGWIEYRVKPREDPTQDASSSAGERPLSSSSFRSFPQDMSTCRSQRLILPFGGLMYINI